MWDTKSINNALDAKREWPIGSPSQFSLTLFDSENRIGIGRDGEKNIVLVLPGQSHVLAFRTEGATFDPWTKVHWVEEDLTILQVATLKCHLVESSDEQLAAVSAVFMGIIDLQLRFGHCGTAIWEMKELFNSRFQRKIDRNVLVGLLGELVVIASAKNRRKAVEVWHSRNSDSFDFSNKNVRLEVKTSTELSRHHHFSSSQINSDDSFEVFVASVILYLVEIGADLESIFQEISENLENELQAKFTNLVIKILGVTPNMVSEIQIDIEATKRSVLYFPGSQIPQPIPSSGVISMNWHASLTGIDGLESDFDSLVLSE